MDFVSRWDSQLKWKMLAKYSRNMALLNSLPCIQTCIREREFDVAIRGLSLPRDRRAIEMPFCFSLLGILWERLGSVAKQYSIEKIYLLT